MINMDSIGLNPELDKNEHFKSAVTQYMVTLQEIRNKGTFSHRTVQKLKLELSNLVCLYNLTDEEEKNKKFLINRIAELIRLHQLLDTLEDQY